MWLSIPQMYTRKWLHGLWSINVSSSNIILAEKISMPRLMDPERPLTLMSTGLLVEAAKLDIT